MADEAQSANAPQQIVDTIKSAMEEVGEKLVHAADAVKLNIRGLNPSSTIESLRAYFEKFGIVDNIEIQKCESIEDEGEVNAFAVIVFGSKEIAESVLAQEEPHVVDGVEVEPKLAEVEIIVIDDEEEKPSPGNEDDVADSTEEEASKPEVIECTPEEENVSEEQVLSSDPQKLIMDSPIEEQPEPDFLAHDEEDIIQEQQVVGCTNEEADEESDLPELEGETPTAPPQTPSEEKVVEEEFTDENQGAEENSEESGGGPVVQEEALATADILEEEVEVEVEENVETQVEPSADIQAEENVETQVESSADTN